MKKYISIILLALFAVMGSAAQNVVSLSSGQGVPGDIVTVDVSLQNSDEVTAVEVVVPLVDRQLTFVDGSCVINSERANGHQLNAAVVDGALRIYIYNISLAPLKGNDGQVASFNLKLGKSPAEYPLQPLVVLSDATGKALPATATNGAVTILAPQIEVVTQLVDFGHIPIMAQYTKTLTLRNSGTLPLEVTGIEFSAPEFTATATSFTIAAGATKSISVAYSPTKRGAIEECVTIISDAVNGNATAALVADPYSVNELHSNRVEGIAGEEVTVELRMNNMEPIVGLQTSFELPDGVEYVYGSFAPTERASSHTAMASVNDKQLTLILYSSKNTSMDGNDGVVATYRLRLDCNSGSYKITPQNTVLSNATVENMVSAVSGDYIVVKSPNISGNKELDFGKTPVTEIAKADYSIKNNGKATLVINSVAFLSTGYRVANELPLSIEQGTTGVLNVEFTPTTEGEHSTTMNIYSNDPDEKLKTVKLSGTVYEPNDLTFEGENLQNGNYVVSIGLDNYTGIVAVQMDIHFMPGMTTSNDYLKVTQRLAGHSCSVTKIDEDTYRFIAFSFNNNSIAGNEGKLFDLTFVPNRGVEYKNAPIVIDNVVLSSSGANNYTSQLTLNAKAEYSNYYVRFVCDGEVVSESFLRAGSSIVQPQMPERTGYTFAGWEGVPELSPAEDVVYTGEYKVNKYKLDYLVNGVVFATDSIAYGSSITLIEAPIREGHTFSGWSEAPATMPANDVTIEGSFTVNTYNVIYKVDGVEYKVVPVVYGSEIVLIEEPTKEGHTFSGWKDEKEDGYVTYPIDIASNADNMLYSNAYCTMGGDRFVGWHVLFDNDMSTYFHSEYASDKTSTDGLDHYLRVDLGDGNEIENFSFTYTNRHDNDSGAPTEIVVEGSNVADGEYTEIAVLADMSTSNSTVGGSATLSFADKAQRTVFNANQQVWVQNGVVLKNNKSASLSAVADYAKPVRFYAYSEVIVEYELGNITQIVFDCSSSSYATTLSKSIGTTATTSVSSDKVIVTLDGTSNSFTIAKLTAQVRLDAITVTCATQECTTYKSDILGNGDKYRYIRFRVTKTVSNSSPSGHPHFCISEFGMTEYVEATSIPKKMPAKDLIVEGEFCVNNYTITYKVDGVDFAVDTLAYGNEIVLREYPTKEGHTFSGWSEAPATMPAEDVIIEGSFAVNTYNVIYKVDGEEYKVIPLAYGSEIILIDAPVKEGHTFSGWSEAPATMPAEDIVIEGTFAVNYYTVTYIVNGEVYATDSIAYGSEIVLLDEPTKEGHAFSGWSEAPATMPAEDVVIEGSFSPITTINGVVYDAEDLIIYNLRGERIIDVDELERGFYIINGKKVFVK